MMIKLKSETNFDFLKWRWLIQIWRVGFGLFQPKKTKLKFEAIFLFFMIYIQR